MIALKRKNKRKQLLFLTITLHGTQGNNTKTTTLKHFDSLSTLNIYIYIYKKRPEAITTQGNPYLTQLRTTGMKSCVRHDKKVRRQRLDIQLNRLDKRERKARF